MRIACVDHSAAQRVALQKIFDDACSKCRSAIGHLNLAQTYPATKEEVLVNSSPAAIAVGPSYSIEEAYAACRDLRQAHPNVPLLLFVVPENYSLRTLRRFEKVTTEVFSTADPSIRLIHRISSIKQNQERGRTGQLTTVIGVKGGVGATSVTAGLAHAAEALGKSAVIVDLSPTAAMSCYMAAPRWQSAEYAAALADRISPTKELIEKCVATAPNGINLFLPPAGGSEVRELWLRDSARFELSLSAIDVLLEMYDLVLVDIAAAEGVFQFALKCRANSRLLVTSNDPASVHLLNTALTALREAPGEGQIQILLNMQLERGLCREDLLDFLYMNEYFEESMVRLESLPFDSCARNWIGTGNSFYTEGTSQMQRVLESTLAALLALPDETRADKKSPVSIGGFLGRLLPWRHTPRRITSQPRALPLLTDSHPTRSAINTEAAEHVSWQLASEENEPVGSRDGNQKEVSKDGGNVLRPRPEPEIEELYQGPKLVINQ